MRLAQNQDVNLRKSYRIETLIYERRTESTRQLTRSVKHQDVNLQFKESKRQCIRGVQNQDVNSRQA